MPDLIIGGSGFVGRNLAKRLESEGKAVVVLDRHEDVTGSFHGRFIQGDAQDAHFLTQLVTKIRPSTVYHLAANSDISAGIADASLDFGDTLMTTSAVRHAVAQSDVQRLVFASSSAIFGIVEGPIGEDPEIVPAPISWYGKAKLASEFILESLAQQRPDLAVLVVRFPNVVGPLATHGVVFDFIRKLRTDPTRLEVLGDGNQTKPYVHVSDLIDGMHFFLERAKSGVTRVNIGPPDLIDVKGIAHEVCEAMRLSPQVIYGDSAYGWVGDVPRYEFDTTAMQALGFTLSTPSAQAVRMAAEELCRDFR